MGGGKGAPRGLFLIPLLGIAVLLPVYFYRAGKPATADEQVSTAPAIVWGGPGIALRTTPGGATIQFNCAQGRIDKPIALDGIGSFDATGTYVQVKSDIGMPPAGEHPARFTGSIVGDNLTLTVTLTDTGRLLGSFGAVHG